MKKAKPRELEQIMNYLVSPAGGQVFHEIEDKPDEYRVLLRIPEPGGHFIVKVSAGSIRSMVRQVVGMASQLRGESFMSDLDTGGGKTRLF